MSKLVIVGGSRGLGYSILKNLHNKYKDILLLDVAEPFEQFNNVSFKKADLSKDNLKEFEEEISSADSLIITAGIGQVKPFDECSPIEIDKVYKINTLSTTKLIKFFYNSLLKEKDKKCLVISSIAGEVSSPLFAAYAASKAAICRLSESLNIELEKQGSNNRVTCVVATALKGTSFYGEKTDVEAIDATAKECIEAMNKKELLHYINKELCIDIINRYQNDRHGFGLSSYDYKIKSGRVSHDKKHIIGYLSGTFDLFHIGHLNLLKRAKEQCDYLIVGVHDSGAWKGKETFIPFEERLEIVRSIKYVDEAHVSFREDSDAWDKYHYDKLFVGSDYIGS